MTHENRSPWVFGYGSLIWGTGPVHTIERRVGVLPGWHREWTWISQSRHGAPTCSLHPGGQVNGVYLRLNPETTGLDLEEFRRRERRSTEKTVSDLPVTGGVTHFWTMGSNLSSFAEFNELTGNLLARALAIRAKEIGEPGPDGVTAEDYIRRVHKFDPADAITAAMVLHLERKVFSLMDNPADVLKSMHGALLEALRHREQEIFSYLAILVPALGGFVWLLHQGADKNAVTTFVAGTVGVLLMLLLGATYSITLGYNYRYITFQLAKIEQRLNVTDTMLQGWPKSPKDFRARYSWHSIPWCLPPEMIKVFWVAFLVGILGVTIVASYSLRAEHFPRFIVKFVGGGCLLLGLLAPVRFGWKIMDLCKKEPEAWPDNP